MTYSLQIGRKKMFDDLHQNEKIVVARNNYAKHGIPYTLAQLAIEAEQPDPLEALIFAERKARTRETLQKWVVTPLGAVVLLYLVLSAFGMVFLKPYEGIAVIFLFISFVLYEFVRNPRSVEQEALEEIAQFRKDVAAFAKWVRLSEDALAALDPDRLKILADQAVTKKALAVLDSPHTLGGIPIEHYSTGNEKQGLVNTVNEAIATFARLSLASDLKYYYERAHECSRARG
jgi:Ca2+/Na+ antiporter